LSFAFRLGSVFRVGDALVRRVRVADAVGIVELGRIVDPNVLSTPSTMRALLEAEASPASERLVGESGGRVVAWARLQADRRHPVVRKTVPVLARDGATVTLWRH